MGGQKTPFLVNIVLGAPQVSARVFASALWPQKKRQRMQRSGGTMGIWGSKKSDDTLGTYYGKPYMNI